MEDLRILLVDDDPPAVGALESALSTGERDVAIATLPETSDLFDVLVRSPVHCLLLPPAVDGVASERIAHGVRGLFPDLPIVIAGPNASAPPALDATAVETDGVVGDGVANAIEAAVDGGVESDAARPPSRAENLLLSMFDQFPVHLYAKDEAGRHVLTSRTNSSPTELIGLTDLEYEELPEDHRKAAYRDDMSVIEGDGKQVEIEEYTDYVDSHTLTTKVPWYDGDDDVIGLVGLTRDITERKKREQAARRQHELLVKVALVAAHELRNELQVASGRLELVEEDSDQIDVIRDSQKRLSNIVDQVVELASSERPHRRSQELWLSTVAREVWDAFDTPDATLIVEEDVHFVGDPESMSLFFQILFQNAIQHAGESVTVRVGAIDGGIYVADDGDGIDVEPADRVFDAGYTTDPDSTGFGLYVARSIADEHGWTIDLSESAAGGLRLDVRGPTVTDEGERTETASERV